MLLLALDTSSEYCSVALYRDGAVTAREELAGQTHSRRLLPMLDALLRETGVAVAAFDGVAFGAGPGSFTGLRIACGVAQGLAFAHDLPVVAVPSLEALAQAAGGPRVFCALDARMGEVYAAAYERAGPGWREVLAPGLYAPAEVPDLPATGGAPGADWLGAGSGFAIADGALARRHAGRLAAVDGAARATAAAVAELGVAYLRRGRAVPAAAAAPVYVRDRVALKSSER